MTELVVTDWHKLLLGPDHSILKTLEIIDTSGLQIAFVVDIGGRLLGTVTDGDVRRAILRGVSLQVPVSTIMNTHPMTASESESRDEILQRMKSSWRHRVPVLDNQRKVIGVRIFEELLERAEKKENWVVIMAGGEGTRLSPLTDTCPKPLLEVGGRPLLETILLNFKEHGFHRFYLSVNYRAEMIEDYFGDGSRLGVEICYVRETHKLGTAGALSLLPERPSHPVLVMNGDVLTKISFEHLLQFHLEHRAGATMGIRDYDLQIPYGVVRTERELILDIEEKPIQRFFVNGGIYVLDPKVLDIISPNSYIDMPDLFRQAQAAGQKTVAFPIREYWLDIGRMSDFERAKGEYSEVFSKGAR